MLLIINIKFLFSGAIGDVDGDGTLDLVSIVSFSAEITDEFNQYVRTQRMTRISKMNLELQLRSPMKNSFVSLNSSQPDIEQLPPVRFRPFSQQPWTAYLGAYGDSSYTAN